MAKQKLQLGRAWYAIKTAPGFEDSVSENIMKRSRVFDLSTKIFQAIVPREKKMVVKNGKQETIDEKIYAGYVLVDMIVNDDSWYLVRNTPHVTGFVGTGSTPIPVSESEIQEIFARMQKAAPTVEFNIKKGDSVKIIDGPLKDMVGLTDSIDFDKAKVRVLVSMFNRETPVEVAFFQIKKIE